MLVAPACYHQTFTCDDSEKINLYFSFARTGKHFVGEDLHKKFERVFSKNTIIQIADAEEFGKRIRMFKTCLESDCVGKSERLRAELTGLVFSLYDLLASETDDNDELHTEPKVGVQYRYEIDRLLSQNYARKIDLEFLSDKLCLSPKRVAVLIKLLYGKSVRRVRTEMKIQVAKQLLKESDLTVGEIASRVGYDSVRGFLTAFMQETGKTPTQYRQEYGM